MTDKTNIINLNMITPGIDSTLGYFYIKNNEPKQESKNSYNVYIDMSSRYTDVEIKRLIYINDSYFKKYIEDNNRLEIIRNVLNPYFVFKYMEYDDAYYINRNLLIATFVTSYFSNKFNDVSININFFNNYDDRVDDGSIEYYQRLAKSKVIKNLNNINLPLKDITKSNLVNWFLNEYKNDDFPKEERLHFLINETFSCYNSKDGKPCLSCKACFRKIMSIYSIFPYKISFNNKELIADYLNDETLPKHRKDIILKYLSEVNLDEKF